MIEIISETIETSKVLDSVMASHCGANVLFVGTTRDVTGERITTRLAYDCYETMATKEMQRLRDEAIEKFEIGEVSIVHRIGEVGVGEASIAVAVSAPHRKNAFAAAEWLMDTLKKQVPIWKQEHWADGTTEWVHPGEPPTSESQAI